MMLKRCRKCGDSKPLAAYYYQKGKPKSACITCERKAQRAYYDTHLRAEPTLHEVEGSPTAARFLRMPRPPIFIKP